MLNREFDLRDDLIRNAGRKKVAVKSDLSTSPSEEDAKQEPHKFVKGPKFMHSDDHEIYDQPDLLQYLTKDTKLTITRNTKSNSISSKFKVNKDTKDQYFENLSNRLHQLSKEFNKDMDEIHMLFMEVS